MASQQQPHNVTMLCSRVQTLLQRRPKQKPAMEISAPFDLKQEPVSLPGVSEDELTILREKAAASRIGVFEAMPHTRPPSFNKISRPSRPAGASAHPARAHAPSRSAW
ncbi:hypothetical protein G6O67_000723 [Ophiocordyceps sinensis]|uniref:Uncharacterized protein n=1 Tax=Ophiocordyceps sinensis TaxID=72228 RepID=A0A8H4VA22_9HYPO|nr:hypothetical protein G6O67_000723 [Ophiocordyceps sinensis]